MTPSQLKHQQAIALWDYNAQEVLYILPRIMKSVLQLGI
jgi:hypothetical protein